MLAHDFIKSVLFETPALVCTTLILGGIVLLLVDRHDIKPRYHDATRLSLSMYLTIGVFQTLALIPGVSRSGSTIVGAMLCGVDKRAAAEFSFFLAMPTMAGAFTYDLYKNRALLSFDDAAVIGVGFVVAFFAALLVVRSLLSFVGRHGYGVFAWWRIVVGLRRLRLAGPGGVVRPPAAGVLRWSDHRDRHDAAASHREGRRP